jgi:hypothetical protein
MKKLIFLTLLVSFGLQAQTFTDYLVIKSGNAAKEGVQIKNRVYTTATGDTTYGQDIRKASSVVVSLQTLDSADIYISYQTSLDNVNWSGKVLKDSIYQNRDGDTLKSVNVSLNALGAAYMRFIFSASAACSNMISGSGATYTATIKTYQSGAGDITNSPTMILGTGTNYIGSTSLPNDNALDSARFNLSYWGTGTYTIGYVIGAATAPTTTPCPLMRLSNAGRVAGGSGYITQIIFFHDSATSTGTIRATFSRDSTGLTMFADKVPYAPSFEALTQRVTSDTVQMFAGTGSGTSFSKGIKSCFLPYVCSTGSTSLWMRLSSESAIVLKNGGCIFYKVTYARN